MTGSRLGRPQGGRSRLLRWGAALGVLGALVVAGALAGRLAGGAGLSGFWRLLGVRVEAPAPAEGSGAEGVGPAFGDLDSGGYGSGPGTGPAGELPADLTESGDGRAAEDGSGEAEAASEKVAAGAVLLRTVTYEPCGCARVTSEPAPEGVVGLDRETLATELRDWEVASFSATRVELRRTERDAMCPAHTKRTLKLEDGQLVLYAGSCQDPGVTLIPLGPTGLTAADLSPGEAEILLVGKTFASHEDALRYIEGLGD